MLLQFSNPAIICLTLSSLSREINSLCFCPIFESIVHIFGCVKNNDNPKFRKSSSVISIANYADLRLYEVIIEINWFCWSLLSQYGLLSVCANSKSMTCLPAISLRNADIHTYDVNFFYHIIPTV